MEKSDGNNDGIANKKICSQSIAKQYCDKILAQLMDELEHSKIVSRDQISPELKESLLEDLEESLIQFQNVSYTRGLFAGQGKKVL